MGQEDTYIERLKNCPFTNKNDPGNPRITTPIVFRLAKDPSRIVTLIPAHEPDVVPTELLKVLHEEFNYVVVEGLTYPHLHPMDFESFLEYWFTYFVAILVEGEYTTLEEFSKADFSVEKWRDLCLGNFFIKPNYMGRCSHVCNGGFIVNKNKRGLGIGTEMGKRYLEWAPQLGFASSVFNLVFETNVASAKIWESLGFEKIGYLKNVAMLKGYDRLVGAHMYGKDFLQ